MSFDTDRLSSLAKVAEARSSPVLTVSQLNRTVREMLEGGLPVLWVAGEISNLTIAASGHCYFSLKDATAQVRCVMFRQRAALLPFRPKEGLQVEVRAVTTLYEARGDFQLGVETIRLAGLGALYEAFERLKSKLSAEGLFDAARKRQMPAMPRTIGIVTSPAAAALRDVLTTMRRRNPAVQIVIYPTQVQGDAAPAQIVAALSTANRRAEVDLLIVCRGGGSIEDLWAFNDEAVARAIAGSLIPVISGVGHETDFTIADFVADVRAPTPTAAAELASPSRADLRFQLDGLAMRLRREWSRQWMLRSQRLDFAARRLLHPGERIARQRRMMEDLARRLQMASSRQLERRRAALTLVSGRYRHVRPDAVNLRRHLQGLASRLRTAANAGLQRRLGALEVLSSQLQALNPDAVLSRGYARVETARGELIKQAATLHRGQSIRLHFADGSAAAAVTSAPGPQGELDI
ncbi:exodeoxyribonuclease VII large subunit [Parachitinimonas caeni]|uniref:exodeoxyribonuclease VII large subunit n=1 Tax=Parachitinimonas caeni TaxID=3031301 RepID=UPI0027E432FF|nr:exodeoxyribonuclease VII large subunit [Parachitinimonas caeni]